MRRKYYDRPPFTAGGGGGVDHGDRKEGSSSVVGGGGMDEADRGGGKKYVWLLFVAKRFFARELPVAHFFLPTICPWLPPKQITNKKIWADLPAGKKTRFLFRNRVRIELS